MKGGVPRAMGHWEVRSPYLAQGRRGLCKGCLEPQEDTGSELGEGLDIRGWAFSFPFPAALSILQ